MRTLFIPAGRILGFPLRVHGLTPLVVTGFAVLGWRLGGGAGAAHTAGLVALALLSLVVHELAHAWMARHRGLPVRLILLGPILSGTYLAHAPHAPRDELALALAGPAANGILAGLLALLAGGLRVAGEVGRLEHWTAVALWINVAMGAGNLLPAFPLDGGRILRALLGFRLPGLVATRIATRVGAVVAFGVPALALLHPLAFEHPALLPVLLVFAIAVVRAGKRQEERAMIRELELQGQRSADGIAPDLLAALGTPAPWREGDYVPLSQGRFRHWRELCERALRRSAALPLPPDPPGPAPDL